MLCVVKNILLTAQPNVAASIALVGCDTTLNLHVASHVLIRILPKVLYNLTVFVKLFTIKLAFTASAILPAGFAIIDVTHVLSVMNVFSKLVDFRTGCLIAAVYSGNSNYKLLL